MNNLQKALLLNAIFSLLSGLILIFFHRGKAELFGVSDNAVFWILGLGLVCFAGAILFIIRKPTKSAVYIIVILDLLWVAGSIVILLWNPFGISFVGNLLITLVGLMVLFMAINQYLAVSGTRQLL